MPRSDIKRYFEGGIVFEREKLDLSLQRSLEDIFELPPASDVKDPLDTDLALDVVVSKFQSGGIIGLPVGYASFPLMWRPKITVGARLYQIHSQKTVYTATSTVKMPLKEYLARAMRIYDLFRLKPLFTSADVTKLLHEACLDILAKLKKRYA